MKISGMQKLTLLDYPGNIACLIFTQGCNFRCPFCHNKDLLGDENEDSISVDEVFSYLDKRKGVLDGVVISGGEPLLQPDIEEFITKVKINIIESSKVEHEFRTTVVKQLHNLGKLQEICSYLGTQTKYYIQNYRDCSTVLERGLLGFSEEELKDLQKKLNMMYPNVMVRGI